MFRVPPISPRLKRTLFIHQIQRVPTTAVFGGQNRTDLPLIARLSQPSVKRQAELAGYIGMDIAMECMLALPLGTSPAPQPQTDYLTVADGQHAGYYRVEMVRPDVAQDCYQLSLTKHNP